MSIYSKLAINKNLVTLGCKYFYEKDVWWISRHLEVVLKQYDCALSILCHLYADTLQQFFKLLSFHCWNSKGRKLPLCMCEVLTSTEGLWSDLPACLHCDMLGITNKIDIDAIYRSLVAAWHLQISNLHLLLYILWFPTTYDTDIFWIVQLNLQVCISLLRNFM